MSLLTVAVMTVPETIAALLVVAPQFWGAAKVSSVKDFTRKRACPNLSTLVPSAK